VLFGALSMRGRNRRNLASAFVGEITAAMEAVEEHAEVKRLHLLESSEGKAPPDFRDLQLPKLTIYETNVGQLSLFDAPLSGEISYFYTRLMALPGHLRGVKSSNPSSAEEMKQRARDAIAEIAQTMDLGENLLRSFRRFISHKQPVSISRA
jgi:hypothetical protein